MTYIWQLKNWPKMTWESDSLLPLLGQARLAQGNLLGRVKRLGFELGEEAQADILTEEAVTTSAIEGERLNRQAVRSSVARHLGLPVAGLGPATRSIDGLIEVLLNATQNYQEPLTAEKLKGWHAALFPTGHSGFHKIRVGQWRGKEPMRVVSGPVGREKIHFEAPPGEAVEKEMRLFLSWWNSESQKMDGLLRAGLAHFYFVTIHPLEDGNGRIARALTDTALAQDEKLGTRYYSLSSQIMEEREEYYRVLEKSSKTNSADRTDWLTWFLGCYQRAIERSDKIIGHVLAKADFWQKHAQAVMNERQKKIVNRLLDTGRGGFQGGLTTRKYVSMAKVSRATAFREISDLVEKRILRQNPAKGRSVNYDLQW
ncbi:MAG: Fic family protein [Candidatus Omnitrophica bacterium]|nr:Fic family protein [Candidatus Omnitrophota bacterium]